MKKKYTKVSDKVKLICYKRMNGSAKVMDFYLVHPKWGREYAFTRRYTRGTYDLVKHGIPVKDLMMTKKKDKMIMCLVKYMGIMIPYFLNEIEWMAA